MWSVFGTSFVELLSEFNQKISFQSDRLQWQIVFIISAVVFVVGNIVYLVFGQMVNQPWDAPDFLTKQQDSHLQEEGYSKALEANQFLEDEKRKESEATNENTNL